MIDYRMDTKADTRARDVLGILVKFQEMRGKFSIFVSGYELPKLGIADPNPDSRSLISLSYKYFQPIYYRIL